MIGSLFQDIRFAVRMLRKKKGFTTVVVLTLALGIGVNAAIFNLVNAMLIRPLPYVQPERLVALHETQPKKGTTWNAISVPDFLDWKEQSQTLEDLAVYARRNYNTNSEEEPERLEGCEVSANLFSMLGVLPRLGRNFAVGEDLAGGGVALISDAVWQRRFRRDPNVLGKTIQLDDKVHEIIGVMPARFAFPEFAEVWTPLDLSLDKQRDYRWLNGIARLKAGVDIRQAESDLAGIARRLEENFPDTNAGWGASVRPLLDELMPQGPRLGMYFMLGAAFCVLLIVAANVATLLLAQATGRAGETALRMALGATRGRLVRQMFSESLFLALCSGALGVLVSIGLVKLMVGAVPVRIPFWIHFDLDARVVAFTVVASAMAAIVFGLAPALRSARAGQAGILRASGGGSGTGPGSHRLHRLLVTSELALSLVLLICAMLMVKSFFRLQDVESGYDPHQLLTLRLSLTADEYKDLTRRTGFLSDVIGRISALPGVESAAAVDYLPISRAGYSAIPIIVDGQPASPGEEPTASQHAATSGYLHTLAIPILSGRDWTPHEADESAPVALINAALAKRLWPGESPLGHRIKTPQSPAGQWLSIIGITGDIDSSYHVAGLDSWPRDQVYVPHPQGGAKNLTLAVRTSGDANRMVPAVRAEIRAAGGNVPIFDLATMDDMITQVVWLPRFWGQIFTAFAAMALLIASIGIYGVTAYSISQRRRELGIRLALGAQPRQLMRLVVGEGMSLALVGVGVGLAVTFAVTRFLAALLYGVSATDPLIFGAVSLLLLAVALLASFLPARRVSRVDPMLELRS